MYLKDFDDLTTFSIFKVLLTLFHIIFRQHLFIPVLPSFLIDYLTAPMPFVIGVHAKLFEVCIDLIELIVHVVCC